VPPAALTGVAGELVATLKTPEGSRLSSWSGCAGRRRERPDGVRPRAGTGGRDRRVPAGEAEAVADPAEPDGRAGRYALGSKAPLLERAAEPKRTAMLTAVMRHLEAKAIDEALDLFQVLMATRLLNTAKRKTEKERLSTLPQLEKASRTLAQRRRCCSRSWSCSRSTVRTWTWPLCGQRSRKSPRVPP